MNGADVRGFTKSRVKTICNASDGVCKGELNITAGHLAYSGDQVQEGADWIKSIVKTPFTAEDEKELNAPIPPGPPKLAKRSRTM